MCVCVAKLIVRELSLALLLQGIALYSRVPFSKASADAFCLGGFDNSEMIAVARFLGLGKDKPES